MKPFVLVDMDTMEIVFVVKNVVKRQKIENLDALDDFVDEFYRRFKQINFVQKYNTIDRKQFMDLIEGLKKSQASVEEPQLSDDEQEIIARRSPGASTASQPKNAEIENSTLIRSNTERRIAVEDLSMKFNEPYDYYDLSVMDQEKVKKSNQLKYFLERGLLVKTTMDEIASIRNKLIAQKEELKKERQEALIVNRKEVMGDDDEMLISSEDYRNAETNSSLATASNVDLSGSEAASAVLDMFSGKGPAVDGDESRSIDELLRKT